MREQPALDSSEDASFWVVRFRRPIFFFLIALSLAGLYALDQVPVSIFPETNFPRVVIGVDNGVMPVEQMQVTITKPIEDAMNAVPGLVTVRSTTCRGSAEVSLFFDWKVDMYRTLQLVDAALSKARQTLPATAAITTNRLTFATFPILGYSLHLRHYFSDPTVGDRELRTETAGEPGARRQHGHGARRPVCPSFTSCPTLRGCRQPELPSPNWSTQSTRRTLSIPLVSIRTIMNSSWDWSAPRCTMPMAWPVGGESHAWRRCGPCCRCRYGRAGCEAGLYHGDRRSKARRATKSSIRCCRKKRCSASNTAIRSPSPMR